MARKFDSGVLDFITGDTSTETVTPLSGAMRAGDWATLRYDLWFRALSAAKGRIGGQFSNNPFEFTAAAKPFAATYVTANGWTRASATYDLFNITDADPAMFFRFVVLGLNTSGALAGSGQVRLVATPTPLKVLKRMTTPYAKINTKGSDSVAAKTPVGDVFETAGITEHRVVQDV